MSDVIIYYTKEYKQDMNDDLWMEIMNIATNYDYQGVANEGDLCIMIGDKDVKPFCKDLNKLEYILKVEVK